MRFDADVGHAGGDSPADIMQAPRFDCAAKAAIEIAFSIAPAREAVTSAIA
jgi:hypothetical protein